LFIGNLLSIEEMKQGEQEGLENSSLLRTPMAIDLAAKPRRNGT
jgi:hypothetical protein